MDKDVRFKDWLVLAQMAGFKIEKCSRPSFVGKHETPRNLQGLSLGQLITLSELDGKNESIYTICETILGMKRKEVERARAVDVVRFVGWVSGEVDKINKLFDKAAINKPTPQEKQAGVETLNFGLFGMLDWFAQRMRIQDHDQVLKMPWLRIYKCIDMDNKKLAYEIRLAKLRAAEMKRNQR